MKTISKIILILVGLSLLVIPNHRVSAASTQISFQKDTDWSSWVQKDVALGSSLGYGTNSGIVPKYSSSTGYAPSGALIYKVSPDGLATWGALTQTQSAPAGTSIDFSFSSSAIRLDQAYADLKARADVKSNPVDVGTSDFLYIRVDLFIQSGSSVPRLQSLAINYTVLKTSTVYTEKHIYKYTDGATPAREEKATFLPGDMIAVKIKLSATNAANMTFKAEDYLLENGGAFAGYTGNSAVERANAVKYCGLSATDTLFNNPYPSNPTSGLVTIDGIVLDGVSGYLCYTYFVPTPTPPAKQAKNDVRQVRLNVSSNNMILATSSNYLMVRGLAYKQSDATPNQFATGLDLIPIDDELLFSFDKFIFKGISGQDISYASAPAYVYKRGITTKSRGGNLYNLPVTITDSTGTAVLSEDTYYLLYNPSVYVMGNLFSKNSLPDSSLDFGSRNNVVSGATVTPSTLSELSKLNAQAGLYNYNIDSGSVAYWNSGAGQVRSQAMQKNINRILGADAAHRPENFCDSTSAASSFSVASLASGNLYLNNDSCQINAAATNNNWPEGRVWYFKPTGDVDLSAKIMTSGTMVFDFADAQSANVNVTFHDGSIASKPADFVQGAYLGIILVNGGNVKFTKDCQMFNGMVFVPGRS